MNDVELQAALDQQKSVNRQVMDLLDVLNERVTTLEARLEDLAITGSSKAKVLAEGSYSYAHRYALELVGLCPECGTVLYDWTEHRCPE